MKFLFPSCSQTQSFNKRSILVRFSVIPLYILFSVIFYCLCLKRFSISKHYSFSFPCFSGDPLWGEWGAWGGCSVTCGGGSRTKSRTCDGNGCSGNNEMSSACSPAACSKQTKIFCVVKSLSESMKTGNITNSRDNFERSSPEGFKDSPSNE